MAAATGAAALELIEANDPGKQADASAAALRDGLNAVIERAGLPWVVYGTSSGFHIFLNPGGLPIGPGRFDPAQHDYHALKAQPRELVRKLRLAMLVNGVDFNSRLGGFLSVSHAKEDIEHTVEAFAEAIRMLDAEGELRPIERRTAA